jgi:hypothetical protein
MDSAGQGQNIKPLKYSFRITGSPGIDIVLYLEDLLKKIKEQGEREAEIDGSLIDDGLEKVKEWRKL